MSQFEMVLTPSKFRESSRSLCLELHEWDKALRISRENGYAPPDLGGMTRDAVRWFTASLRDAVQAGRVRDADRGWVEKLIGFLAGDAKGGFTQARQWRRAVVTK